MKNPVERRLMSLVRSFCLTDLSTTALIGGAIGVSALLWLFILAVL